jgi:hypothetical protein
MHTFSPSTLRPSGESDHIPFYGKDAGHEICRQEGSHDVLFYRAQLNGITEDKVVS